MDYESGMVIKFQKPQEGNGNSNGDMIKGQHLRPLMRLVQRRNMWFLGLGRQFFENGAVIEVKYPQYTYVHEELPENVI